MSGLPTALEEAYDHCANDWLALGKRLGTEPSASLAHAPACAAHPSDLGLMLAWAHLTRGWAGGEDTILVICDDPWMFRHLREFNGVSAGTAPALWPRRIKLTVRGFLARSRYAVTAALSAFRFDRGPTSLDEAALLVYGHSYSDATGRDAFFGDMMARLPRLNRLLHVDVGRDQVTTLCAGERTHSLHAWGNPLVVLSLPFARWRPPPIHRSGQNAWLVRRAADLEGGTGQSAAIAWQNHCQQQWLVGARPRAVAWPWENHSWERAFVRHAQRLGVKTIGFQHSVVGHQMLNYSVGSNPDGLDSIPDLVLCNGPATRDQLLQWSMPENRTAIGGALRHTDTTVIPHDPEGPVFFALPSETGIGRQMAELGQQLAAGGRKVLIKEHPLYPVHFTETEHIKRTLRPLLDQDPVSLVIYAGTTVGLEAILMGLPTLRFRPEGRISLDILPLGISVPTIEAGALQEKLGEILPPAVPRERIFAPVNWDLWLDLLAPAP